MSITTDSKPAASLPRPYAGSFGTASFTGTWVCSDLMSPNHHSTVGTTGSKRLNPGSFAGVLT